ncbi:PepSY domain-containing protein [Solitalea koreensis]|uniref:PepSY-associated TM region n=1 Tax=Solitalea koreensis TaxID=543615 RepID=A0A521E7I9_9SPHI|nr:PepSY domain-containing protein [Solitalea koreensis]SMO79865.1 PepSY-associated TM region [Solitalea koreensis]
MIKRNIYKWHRSLSILIALPVIMWTISGIMHPLMTTIKPKIKNQFLYAKPIDSASLAIGIDKVLLQNQIKAISNFRIVQMNEASFYQVKLKHDAVLHYFNAKTGQELKSGDQYYADQLAAKLLGDDQSKITSTQFVQSFDKEYVEINRLLPVYKVSFDRNDGIRLYVDTSSDRLGLAMDNKRAIFNSFFRNFHSWEFLHFFGSFRLFVLGALASIAFLTVIMGIYISRITKAKTAANSQVKYRRWHRRVAVSISITTLMFTSSGAYHALKKIEPDTRADYFMDDTFNAEDLAFSKSAFFAKGGVVNVSLVKMEDQNFLRVSDNGKQREDCCEKMNMASEMMGMKGKGFKSSVHYYSLPELNELKNGDAIYANYMAARFSGNDASKFVSSSPVTNFEGEYGFVNKRLPVMKVQFNTNHNERFYVETSTGKLSTRIDDEDLHEGLSFAMLHKFHFTDALGKTTRDVITIIAAFGNLLATLLGCTLLVFFYLKKKKKVIAN